MTALLKVTMESILQETADKKDIPPSQKAFADADAYLRKCGYRNENTSVYRAVLDYIARRLENKARKGLFLRGPRGVGKTLGAKIISMRFNVPFVEPANFLELFTQHHNDRAFIEAQVISGFNFFATAPGERASDIVIDDLGAGQETASVYGNKVNFMAEVLEIRHNALLRYGVKTIVTSNLTDTEIQQRYGQRIDDRFNQDYYFATVDGRSLRG